MVKKLSMFALAGLLALPATNVLADDMQDLQEKVDLISRIQLSGDFRARMDYYSADIPSYYHFMDPLNPAGAINPGNLSASSTSQNDTIMTNRFRLNIRAKATENVDFKGRLAMYKAWGMQNTPTGVGSFSGFNVDYNNTRQPKDSALYVDRAFMNWNNIADLPIWFSIGRRPTTDGPPANLRMGLDQRMATPTAFMDWPFDGVSIGYAYSNTARVRFCWGRGFEDGLQNTDQSVLDDTDFAGFSWDVYKKGSKLAYLQSFMAFNLPNYPTSPDGSLEAAMGAARILQGKSSITPTPGDLSGVTMPEMIAAGNAGRTNVGNILHTSGVWMDKVGDINYFVSAGWSMTDPDSSGMFNEPTLAGPVAHTDSENGYIGYAGVRYDLDDLGLKVGLEYNYGSEYWIGLTPGNDDLYQSKLATRGSVYEIYAIYDLPSGDAVSKFGKAFMRLGYQRYEYDYTGSGDWNNKPIKIDDLASSSAYMQMATPIDTADQVYLTMEMYF